MNCKTGKKCYPTEKSASSKRNRARKTGQRMRAYKCSYCSYYHLSKRMNDALRMDKKKYKREKYRDENTEMQETL